MRPAVIATFALGALALGAATQLMRAPPAPAAPARMDLQRYLGRWYVIARSPAHEDVGAYFEFHSRGDGRIEQVYYGRGAFDRAPDATAVVAEPDPDEPAHWKIDTGWFSSEDRRVLYVSPDYRLALAGAGAPANAWVLARAPEIAEWSYAGLLARLSLQGYDVSKLKRVAQRPEQVGKAGYE